MAAKIRKGDKVIVLNGRDKGRTGEVFEVRPTDSKALVRGINLITIVWTDGDRVVPCDYRLYDKAKDGLTKNDHFLAMLPEAKARGFDPADYVMPADIALLLDDTWKLELSETRPRAVSAGAGAHHTHDIVLRALRLT